MEDPKTVSGARAHARIADLSIQTLVDSQSDTKYTPRRSSSVFNPSLYVQDPPMARSSQLIWNISK